MTDDELTEVLAQKGARLAAEAARQAAEPRARQMTGDQPVGPWVPPVRVVRQRRRQAARVLPLRRRA